VDANPILKPLRGPRGRGKLEVAMNKSPWIVSGTALAAALTVLVTASLLPASAADHVVRIGYQKYGNFILLKGTGELEKKLAPKGFTVEWTEFPSGPPLLEAVKAGAIDIGPDRRIAADLRPGRRRRLSLYRPRAAGAEGRSHPGAEG
jgi:hypothetical protein